MSTETKTKPAMGIPTQWPPLAHIARKRPGTVKKDDMALCGAKLMGINLDDAREVCEECVRIFRSER